MASTERIQELISKEALAQFEQLKATANENVSAFEKLVAKAVDLNKALGGAKTFKEASQGMKEMSDTESLLTKKVDELTASLGKLQKMYDEQAKRLADLGIKGKDATKSIDGIGDSFADMGSKLDSSGSSFKDAIANLVNLNNQLKQNKAAQKELQGQRDIFSKMDQDLPDVQKGLAAIAAKEQELVAQEKLLRGEITATNKEIRQRINLNRADVDTREFIKQQITDLKSERDLKVNINTDDGLARLAEINAEIDRLNKILEQTADNLEQRKINIGNYPGAAKIIVDALEKTRVKSEQLNTTLGASHPAAQAARREFDALSRIVERPQFLKVAANVGDATKEVRHFTKELIYLEREGLGNSEVANDLREKLAELTDQIGDTRAEVKALSSDSRDFDLFAGAVNIVADAFQTAAGFIGLYSDNEKEVQEITKNLIAITAVSNGVKSIANELTTRGTAANKIYAFFQNQVAIATSTSASATARLGAALKLLTTGIVIGAIIAIITNFTKLKNLISGLSKEQAINNDINKKAIDGYIKEKVQVEGLVKEVKNENTSKARKKEIIAELNAISPNYFGHIKTETDLQTKLNDAVTKYILALQLKAKAEVAYEKLIEAERPIVERQIKLEQDLERIRSANFGSEEKRQANIAKLQKRITDGTDEVLVALQKRTGPIRKVVADINEQLDAIGGDPSGQRIQILQSENRNFLELQKIKQEGIKDLNDRIVANEENTQDNRLKAIMRSEQAQLNIIEINRRQQLENVSLTASEIAVIEARSRSERIKTEQEFFEQRIALQKQYREREIVAQMEILKSNIQANAEINQQVADNEKKSLTVRLEANKNYFDRQKALIELQRDSELRNKKLTEDERKVIQQKADNELLLLQLDFIKKSNEIANQGLEKSEQNSINRNAARRDKLLAGLARDRADGLVNEEDYLQRRLDIEFRYAKSEVQILIATTKEKLDIRRAAGEDVTGLLAQLAAYERQLEDESLAHTKETEEAKFQIRMERLQKISEISANIFGVIAELSQIQYDTEKVRIEEAIADIEKRRDAELAAINASAISEQEKADKIQILEAKTQAQKEQQERRLKQIEADRAKFERAITIQKIIADTASAIMAALGANPTPLGIAFAATIGALGAAQLARVIATPLPRFAEGTEDAPGGLSVLGDAGRSELVKEPSGKMWVTPKVPTVMNVPKHSIVYPDVRMMLESGLVVNRQGRLVESGTDTSKIEQKLDRLTSVIKNKPVLNMRADQSGLTAMWQYGANTISYVEDQVRF